MKKTIKSTISIILALCMLLASMVACRMDKINTEQPDDPVIPSTNDEGVPIQWYSFSDNESMHLPVEEYVEYFCKFIPENEEIERTLTVTLYFDYIYSLENMPEEFKSEYFAVRDEYGDFRTDKDDLTSDELAQKKQKLHNLRLLSGRLADDIASQKYDSLDFKSSISPSSIQGKSVWYDDIGTFRYITGSIVFEFENSKYKKYGYNVEDLENWEWKDKLKDLSKIQGLELIVITLSERSTTTCP
ncbi:MAG: hypothetical protein E7633_07470 [Ruminococcaceae bacterium]|nr:hypothetical protein [Oscillospiraceae bacterium]